MRALESLPLYKTEESVDEVLPLLSKLMLSRESTLLDIPSDPDSYLSMSRLNCTSTLSFLEGLSPRYLRA
jgi:hypothetical protein